MNGPFGNGFPYTNFHELNMDWIIRIAKDFLDQYTHIQDIISSGETSLQETTAAGIESLQAEKERLEGLLDAWFTEHSEDIAGELASAISDFRTAAEAIGAEVIASIPEDYTDLSNEVELNKESTEKNFEQITGNKGLIFVPGYYKIYADNTVVDLSAPTPNSDYVTTLCPCSYGDKFTIKTKGGLTTASGYGFYDADGKGLARRGTNATVNGVITVDKESAAWIAINNHISNNPTDYYAFKGEKTINTRVTENASDIESIIEMMKPYKGYTFKNGSYLEKATGQTAESASWSFTKDYIPLNGAKKLYMTIPGASETAVGLVAAVAFYSGTQTSTFISSEPCIESAEDTLVSKFVDVPSGAEYMRVSVKIALQDNYVIKGLYGNQSEDWGLLRGKTVAIIGDSISTNGNDGTDSNVPEILIHDEDVGVTLKAYLTFDDTHYRISGSTWGEKTLTIGGVDFTSAQMGQEITFTPSAEDVGKCVGLPHNYNENSLKTWWENMKDEFGFDAIPVCWSGSSITSHEYNEPMRMCSYAWHESQIRKCGIRTPGTTGFDSLTGKINRTEPDMIIIYRGTNDMTHTTHPDVNGHYDADVFLTDGYFDNYNWQYPETDAVTNGYGFKEAYCKTIGELRNVYPNAKIFLCTLNVFKRVNYEHFPTNNYTNSLPQYNDAIREIADFMGCGVIEFDKDGITFENCYSQGYITDSASIPTHPTNKGHKVMGKKAIADIMAQYSSMT